METLPLSHSSTYAARGLRFQRERNLIRRYRESFANDSKRSIWDQFASRSAHCGSNDDGRQGLDLSRMSLMQASQIQYELVYLEFPRTFSHSLELGFIQTLAFPYPAKILNDTHQISGLDASPKRIVDTSVIMENIYNFPPDYLRFQTAISRINYIHSRYKGIKNQDMLYTLAVFACNPWHHIDKDEWRQLSVLEVAAMGTFWMNIGQCLRIDMSCIKGMAITHATPLNNGREDIAVYSSTNIPDWGDGFDFMLDLRAYMRWHEQEHAEYSDDVGALVSSSFKIGTRYIPTSLLKRIATDIVVSEFHERWLQPMGLSPPNVWTSRLFRAFTCFRRLYLRYIALPRPSFWSTERTSSLADPQTGRFHQKRYPILPFYVRPSTWNRYGPSSWSSWLFSGTPLPGDDGGKYRPEGYSLEEIGPEKLEGKGKQWMEENRQWCNEKIGASACPFAGMMKE